MRYIGVDIGSHSIKCVVLKKVGGVYSLHFKKLYYYPEKEKPSLSKWLKLCLQDFVKVSSIKRPIFFLSFPCDNSSSIVRILSLPKVGKKELTQSILYETEEKNIQGINSMAYKWAIVRVEEDTQDVLVATSSKETIKAVKALKSPLWFPSVVEPQVLSLSRLIEKNSVVIDFGHNSTRLMIYKDGLPFSVQVIEIGGKFLTQKINEERIFLKEFSELQDMTSEEIKHTYSAALGEFREIENNPITIKISDIIDESIKALVREIKQSLRILEINSNFLADNFYYTGEGSKLKYLMGYVERELGVELAPLDFTVDSPREETLQDNDLQEEELNDFPFLLASGTYLYKDFPQLKAINFMQLNSIKIDFQKIFFMTLGFSIILHAGMFDINRRAANLITKAEQQISTEQQTVAMLQNRTTEKENISRQYVEFGNFLTRLEQQKRWFSDILYEVPSRTPKDLTIKVIRMKGSNIILEGVADNYSDIAFFAVALEDIGNVDILYIEEDEAHNFAIELVVNRE